MGFLQVVQHWEFRVIFWKIPHNFALLLCVWRIHLNLFSTFNICHRIQKSTWFDQMTELVSSPNKEVFQLHYTENLIDYKNHIVSVEGQQKLEIQVSTVITLQVKLGWTSYILCGSYSSDKRTLHDFCTHKVFELLLTLYITKCFLYSTRWNHIQNKIWSSPKVKSLSYHVYNVFFPFFFRFGPQLTLNDLLNYTNSYFIPLYTF